MQAQFENIFKQINAAAAEAEQDPATETTTASSKPAQPAASKAGAAGEASFQDTIRATMERMQNSGDQATAAATSDSGADDFMSEMLKSLSSGDFNPDGSEEDFSKMLMGMMEQLTNKDILYEPMKELHDKFPAWMEKNQASTSVEDMTRYKTQQEVVAEIVAKFEESTYSDSNTADREYIVDRMQKVRIRSSHDTLARAHSISRCKPKALRRLTWWATWRQRKKRSVAWTISATRSESVSRWKSRVSYIPQLPFIHHLQALPGLVSNLNIERHESIIVPKRR